MERKKSTLKDYSKRWGHIEQVGMFRIVTIFCSCRLPRRAGNRRGYGQQQHTHNKNNRHVSGTSLLSALHWLPVKARIHSKIACLCFQCLSHNTMPPYLSVLLHPYHPSRTLRSLDTSLLSVPRFCLDTFGCRSFSFLAPLSGIPYLYLSEKLNGFQLSKRR